MFIMSSAVELSHVTLIESCSSSKEKLEILDLISNLKPISSKIKSRTLAEVLVMQLQLRKLWGYRLQNTETSDKLKPNCKTH